jgi:hypothetical protein
MKEHAEMINSHDILQNTAQHLLRLGKIMNSQPKYSIHKLPKHNPSESVEMYESKHTRDNHYEMFFKTDHKNCIQLLVKTVPLLKQGMYANLTPKFIYHTSSSNYSDMPPSNVTQASRI